MAVYRCSVQKPLNRAKGQSAVAAAAYRAAARLHNKLADKRHDYRRRAPGVAHSAILAPDDAPEWARDRAALWNEAEAAEVKRNANLAREVLLSLPHEMDDAQRIHLVEAFSRKLVQRYGVAVDMSVHRPDRGGDQRNHHAHLLMTTRRLGKDGFTEKTRELDEPKGRGPAEIEAIRELWEKEQNRALERCGLEVRVSRLSNQAQGLEREPEPKIGEAANALYRRGETSEKVEKVKEVRQRNSMRENMARQRQGRLGNAKRQDVAKALRAAALAAPAPERPAPDSTPPAGQEPRVSTWRQHYREAERAKQQLEKLHRQQRQALAEQQRAAEFQPGKRLQTGTAGRFTRLAAAPQAEPVKVDRKAALVALEKQQAAERKALEAQQRKARRQIAEAMEKERAAQPVRQPEAPSLQVRSDEVRQAPLPGPPPSPPTGDKPPSNDLQAMRAWERQRQQELRRQREAREAMQDNQHDPGRVRKRPEPS